MCSLDSETSVRDENSDADLSVGRKIRHRRWQRGETQPELACKLGISYKEVQLYETGVRLVPTLLLRKIAEAQETPLSYYLDSHDEQ